MNDIEKQYVYNVYNKICHEFNTTRVYPWPPVTAFMNSIPSFSTICDVGCGNGKNIYRNDLIYMCTDLSEQMCNITYSKQKNDAIQSNILALPFNSSVFDYVICIACVHHLSTFERRQRAVNECYRILKPGGKLLISVWSSSKKYGSGDQYILWNNSEKRYYHMFNRVTFEALFNKQWIVEIHYSKHNFYAIISKL